MIHRRDTEFAEIGEFFTRNSLLRVLRGDEKKFKNDEKAKISFNEIQYLQMLIFAKIDFFSCPAPPW